MPYQEVLELFRKLRLSSYRSIYENIRDREGSLSATEAYAVDAIYLLGEPTIKRFSDFLGISQPNATYKVNSLIAKGYVEKVQSETDKRKMCLRVSEKFHRYYDQAENEISRAADLLCEEFSAEEIGAFKRMLKELTDTIK